jgi:hypothetical protein
MASFAGKLLVDSKHLVSEHSQAEAEAYFAGARTVAIDIEESPYQTERERTYGGWARIGRGAATQPVPGPC